MTEKYDSYGINVNRSSKKFFPIIGKLEKVVNHYRQRERWIALYQMDNLFFFLFLDGREHVRLLRTPQVGLFVTVIQPSANESIMAASIVQTRQDRAVYVCVERFHSRSSIEQVFFVFWRSIVHIVSPCSDKRA